MTQITETPNEYNFGYDFNYSLWTQDTRLTLVNVRWNNDYRDIVQFDSKDALNDYINSLETTGVVINNLSYVKPMQPIRIDLPFNIAYRYNYLRASNPAQPLNGGDSTKDFYYFITDVKYIAPNTTEVVLQLDVWQTFGFEIQFGNSYVERGHIGIANQKAFDNFGRDYLTIPEGIDYGGEYRVIAKKHETVMGIIPTTIGDSQIPVYSYNVLVVSTVDLNSDPGNVTNPVLVSAKGSGFEGLASGASIYVFNTLAGFQSFMENYADTPWVTQGIISITIIPKLSRYQPDFEYTAGASGSVEASSYGFGGASIAHQMFSNWRDDPEIINQIPERYRHLLKFFTYPYMIIEATTWTGKPIIIKPESWADSDATIVERATLTPPNARIDFYPRRYNASIDSQIDNMGHLPPTVEVGDYSPDGSFPDRWKHGDDGGDYLDTVTSITNFPTMSVVNNGAINYLASNSNSIPFMRQSADWSQSRALASNQTTYDQQKAAIETSKTINSIDRAAMGGNVAADQLALRESVAANGLASVIGGVASPGSMLVGGGMGAMSQIMGGVNADININRSNTQLAVNQTSSRAANIAQTNQAGMVADTNKHLADWAARGDYANAISGINAKVQDAMMIQPSTSGQIGGEAANLVNSNVEISLRWKFIDNSAIKIIGEYWLRYGYSVRKFVSIPANLKLMSKFTYWKLTETYIISGMMPEYFKQAIRGIFEKGVTVWVNPNDIGNVDIADNYVVEGIEL